MFKRQGPFEDMFGLPVVSLTQIQLGKECRNRDVSSESKAKLRKLEEKLVQQLGEMEVMS